MLRAKQENGSRMKMSAEEWKQCKKEGKYRGVERRKCGTYVATIGSGPTRRRLGTFDSPDRAAFAYEEAKRKRDKEVLHPSCPDSSNRAAGSQELLQQQEEQKVFEGFEGSNDSVAYYSGSGLLEEIIAPYFKLPVPGNKSNNTRPGGSQELLQQQEEHKVFEGSSSSTGPTDSVAYYSGSGLLEEIIAPFFKLPVPGNKTNNKQ